MRKSKSPQPKGWPWHKPRRGAAAEFARAMARAEFGRNYVDDSQLEEVQRSLARTKASRAPSADAKRTNPRAMKNRTHHAKEEG